MTGRHRQTALFLAALAWLTTTAGIKPGEIALTLPKFLQNSKMEFSSMAWYKNTLLLVPQYPDRFGGQIYGISATSISSGIRSGKAIGGYSTWIVDGLDAVKNKIGDTYEGVEATVILGRDIYFTIESSEKNADCYLVEGRFSGDRISLDPGTIVALPKEKRLSNAGFESLVYWPEKKQLISFFEYNKEPELAKALVIDPATLRLQSSIPLLPLPFRITDVIYSRKRKQEGRFLAINHLYEGKKENAEYVGADSLLTNEPSLAGKNLKHTNYTRLVWLNPGASSAQANWSKARDIDFTDANWEGIAAFKDGVLLVTDEYPGSVLKWFRLPGTD